MSAAEQYVDPDTQLALYRMYLQRETGRISLAYSDAEIRYNADILARIMHPDPASVPAPDSNALNELAADRSKLIAAVIDADLQLRERGIPKDFLEQMVMPDEYVPPPATLTLVV